MTKGKSMKNLTVSFAIAALVALAAPHDAQADLLLPNGNEIFDDHDNPAPFPCHPSLFHGAWIKSGLKGWGPWGATTEVRTNPVTPSNHPTAITYTDIEDPPWSCEDEALGEVAP